MPEVPVQQWIADAKAGDPEAIDRLVDHYLPRLHAYVRVKMGDVLRRQNGTLDLVHSVCREVLEERTEMPWEDANHFLSWLLRVGLNKIREKARYYEAQKRNPNRVADYESLAGLYGNVPSPSQIAMGREQVDAFEEALLTLHVDAREAVVLSRVVGLPLKDVAQQIDRSVDATRMLIGRALVRLSSTMGLPPGEE